MYIARSSITVVDILFAHTDLSTGELAGFDTGMGISHIYKATHSLFELIVLCKHVQSTASLFGVYSQLCIPSKHLCT